MKRDGYNKSLWQTTTNVANTPKISASKKDRFDVIITGAGITGISTALLLQKQGKSVMIAEAQNMGFGTTGGTTAHINTFLETQYHDIQKDFGDKETQFLANEIKNAFNLIKENISTYNIECGYKQLPGYIFSQNEEETKELEKILEAAVDCHLPCSPSNDIPVNIPFEKAIRFDGQAQFHPTRYITALATEFEKLGGVIMENCRVTDVDESDNEITVTTSVGKFLSNHFIYATHIPPGVNLLHFRCAPYRSYVIAARLAKKEDYPDALVYDMEDPYHYYRTQEIDGQLYLIAGGEDHKTGHETNPEKCFRNLEAHIRKYFSVEEVSHRWSSQYFESTDGLPYIGHLPGHPGNIYVATGYSGTGMINSALAAITLTQLILTGKSDLGDLLDPNRIKMVAGFNNFVKEAADVVGHLFKKAFVPAEKLSELAEIATGEAKVVKYEGHTIALYKDEEGKVHAVNSACTHIKCEVGWNNTERSWDCPCHGSRFSYTGEMLTAPARKDLDKIEIGEKE